LAKEYESQIDRRVSQVRCTFKMKKTIPILIGLAVLAFVAFAVYSAKTADSRDWAEVTITLVSANGADGFEIKLEERHVNGGGIKLANFINGNHVSGHTSRGSQFFLFGPPKGTGGFGMGVTPLREPGAVAFTNTPEFRALQALVGKTHRFYAGEDYPLYDFTYGTNHYQSIYSVVPRD
jgi:hypothetical protein